MWKKCRIARARFYPRAKLAQPPPPPATGYRRFSTTQRRTTDPVKSEVADSDDDNSITIHQPVAIDFTVVEFAVASPLGVGCLIMHC